MTTLRAFTCDDLFRFNNILVLNPAPQYGIPFYLQYLAHWPEYFVVAEAPGGELMGYSECGAAAGAPACRRTSASVIPELGPCARLRAHAVSHQ
uniref:N-acetyltransferase domain-containing protein n=1 Tax=Accipiter nisus TaxID=211598 RepID=A0A8B9NGN3_9AVES